MHWRPLMALLCLPSVTAWAQKKPSHISPVSEDWILRARQTIERKSPVGDLIREFAITHKDLEAFPSKSSEWSEPYLNLVPVDLDGDGVEEQVLIISGAYKDQTRLYLLRQSQHQWKVLYSHRAWNHNEAPTFEVLTCEGGKHAFRFVHLEGRGTGIWRYTNLILRAVNQRVVCGLEFVHEHNFALAGYEIHGWAKAAKVATKGNELKVDYVYEFSGGPTTAVWQKFGEEGKDAHLVLRGTAEVTYLWEPETGRYKVASSPLSDDQLRCFMRLQDEALILNAYRGELQRIARNGTPIEQALARDFLKRSPAKR